MAILIDFHKIQEDETRVEYQFGFQDQTDRTLVIDKASRVGRPTDGLVDKTYAAALWKIFQYEQQEKSWPAQGSYAA